MRKIIFSDLDGTLLQDDKTISLKDQLSIKAAIDQGNYFVIATGRPFASAIGISEELGLNGKGCFLIAYNGAMIYDCDHKQVIYDQKLTAETVQELFELAGKEGLYIHTYDESTNGIIASYEGEESAQYTLHKTLQVRTGEKELKALKTPANKTIIIDLHDHEKLQRFQEKYREWAKGKCDFIFSCMEYLEEVPVGVSKGFAVSWLARYLHVPMEDTIAAGDERNDISMIKTAGIGVAMVNGHPDTLKAADYITEKNNNENAMTEIMKKFVLE